MERLGSVQGEKQGVAQLRQAQDDMPQPLFKAAVGQAKELSHDPQAVAQSAFKGPAQAVPHQQQMEAAFGQSFSGVQAFSGPAARAACDELNAEAFAMGDKVAFADAQPSVGLVAHELTHTVQTGAVGDQVHRKGRDGSPGELEAQADRIGAAVSEGKAVQEPILKGAGLMRSERLGNLTFKDGFSGLKGGVNVHARTVEEWKTFLANDADEVAGNIELVAFMAAAIGDTTPLTGVFMVQAYSGKAPTQKQAVDLMQAFLDVGSNIDLPDWSTEGVMQARAAMASLMSRFNNQFAAQALVRKTRTQGEMTESGHTAIKAYAEDAADMQGQAGHGGRSNPVHSLIAAALGTAFGGAAVVASLPGRQVDPEKNKKKSEAFKFVTNGARTISGCLEQAAADRETQKTVLVTAFKMAAGVAGVLTAGTTAVILAALSPVAEEFLGQLLSGDGKSGARKLKDEFGAKVSGLVSSHGMDATDEQVVKNTFASGVDY